MTTKASTYSSIFGTHKECDLPYPTAIELYDDCPCSKVEKLPVQLDKLLAGLRTADEHSYFHATNHGTHALNFFSIMNIPNVDYQLLYTAALLHDIGKKHYHEIVSIPRKLTADEYAQVKEHSIRSFLDLQNANAPLFVQYAGLFHHLSYDKMHGYPEMNGRLSYKISEVAKLYHERYEPVSNTFYKEISDPDWLLISGICMLDAFDAATDINRVTYNITYKGQAPLSKVAENFNTLWGTWYDERLEKPFKQYVTWLRTKIPAN